MDSTWNLEDKEAHWLVHAGQAPRVDNRKENVKLEGQDEGYQHTSVMLKSEELTRTYASK